ncbi:MAG TPA: hypothetical protein VIT65_27200 [Microlunatus sp.]
MITVVTGVVFASRDAVVGQLDARAAPKTEVRADVAPLLALAGVELDKKTVYGDGAQPREGKRVTLHCSPAQLDLLQRRYDLMVLIRQWAGWVALALLAVSVATSRYRCGPWPSPPGWWRWSRSSCCAAAAPTAVRSSPSLNRFVRAEHWARNGRCVD